jgi:prepilin-type N-terminal cleavage/methylation domain-containing protein
MLRPFERTDQCGFTLIELALVLCAIAVLAATMSPDFRQVLLRSRSSEARASLQAIANAEMAYYRDHGAYLACAPSIATPPKGQPGSFDLNQPGWKQIGFRADGPVLYRYEVKLRDKTYDVVANGDLDGDGVLSSFTLHGDTLVVSVEQELE